MCPDPGLYLSCKHACFFKRVNRHSCIHKNVSRKIALWQQVFERSEVEEVQEGEETKKIVSQSQGERIGQTRDRQAPFVVTPASLLIARRREALFINRTAFICSGFCVKTRTSLLDDHAQKVLLVSHATPPGFLLSWRGRDRESSGEIESKQQKERARDRRPRRERDRNQVRRGWRGGESWVREKKTWQHFRWAFPPST